ncbi:rubrerythrin [Halobacteriales archaeon QS_6_71_20]|nr:MAG: rubrerythrin [Halobacteriales archaeon QS_6_71_20]
MSLGRRVASDHQLARLLQIGVVLEEVVEARSTRHHREMSEAFDRDTATLLREAASESADHRERLEELIDDLDAESVSYDEIETLVEAQYGKTKPEDFDGVLYDQLCNEETAYKFYDDLVAAIEGSDSTFSVDRDRVLDTLRGIREEEAEGVEEVTAIMERR